MEVFSKRLSNTDSTVRLAIPSSALPHFENLVGCDLPVTDWGDQKWKFRFSVRNVGHARPVFTGDWVSFAQAKRLQVNDLLIFTQLEHDPARPSAARLGNAPGEGAALTRCSAAAGPRSM
ncbi:hypothetical protein Patl1_29246 [Pistacia atlantica]|uniref:Uncharacterized protein n=1 Tax=Pistacia atlantica TaxID=434234 RepID=A0ACC1BG55_9ROSI|nr:hypothetical protein Patl1_29246 [Pistacia atlantica]